MVSRDDKVFYWFIGKRAGVQYERPAHRVAGRVVELVGDTVNLDHGPDGLRLGVPYSEHPRPGCWSHVDSMTPEQAAAWRTEFEA